MFEIVRSVDIINTTKPKGELVDSKKGAWFNFLFPFQYLNYNEPSVESS